MARPGFEPRTSDLRVRCPTDCATRPGIQHKKVHIWYNLVDNVLLVKQWNRHTGDSPLTNEPSKHLFSPDASYSTIPTGHCLALLSILLRNCARQKVYVWYTL